jgi:alpha-galactosidase
VSKPGAGTLLDSLRQTATTMTVSTGGYLALELRATDAREGINYDHADWAAARFVC